MNFEFRADKISAAIIGSVLLLVATGSLKAQNAEKSAVSATASAVAQVMNFSKQTYTYKTVGDCKIQADVYRASGDEVRPVTMWIHGGALISGNRSGINQGQLEKYLKAGYTVISIDYRLAAATNIKA